MTLVPPLTDGSVPEEAPRGATGSVGPEEEAHPELEVVAPASAGIDGEQASADVPSDESDEDGSDEDGGATEPRRYPSTLGGAFYLLILAATVVGLVIVSTGRWRTGVHWIGGALVVAAGLRVVLPSRDAGMLAVRNRWFDAVLLAGSGVALWALATSIPDA